MNAWDGFSVLSYTLHLNLIEYKTLVLRGDLEKAEEILPTIPKDHLNRSVEPSSNLTTVLASYKLICFPQSYIFRLVKLLHQSYEHS